MKLYYEHVTERFDGKVLSSTVHEATAQQIDDCRAKFEAGHCPHTIVYDEPGWLYDIRICGICGAGLGTV